MEGLKHMIRLTIAERASPAAMSFFLLNRSVRIPFMKRDTPYMIPFAVMKAPSLAFDMPSSASIAGTATLKFFLTK